MPIEQIGDQIGWGKQALYRHFHRYCVHSYVIITTLLQCILTCLWYYNIKEIVFINDAS